MPLDYASIADLIPDRGGKLVIAYSGGIDSQVLLHLCANQDAIHGKILAVYIHHGLQTAADDWQTHCSQQAQALKVAFQAIKVNAHPNNGESPEAAARRARYAALQPLLQPNDTLLLAQHREDQMETLLLQLFRGAGLRGLAAMPATAAFGQGLIARPLLNVGKSEILQYAQDHDLQWVDDPSNRSSEYDRNFLRNQVIPLLKQRWPAIDKTVARSAAHCGEALGLLQAWSGEELKNLSEPKRGTIRLDQLARYDAEQRRWLIREWLAQFDLQPPSVAVLHSIEQQLIASRDDTEPHIAFQGRILKKYRGQLYCLPPQALAPVTEDYRWHKGITTATLGNGTHINLQSTTSGIPQQLWYKSEVTLRPRNGGEKLKLAGRNGHHELKKLYQEAGIPPWERQSRPLLYLDNRLAAVPNLWIAEWAYSNGNEPCYRLIWEYADNAAANFS